MKKLLVALLAVALTLFGAVLPLVLPRHCPVNKAACERIEVGMTKREVEKILGGPPGDYRTRPVLGDIGSGGGIDWTMWIGDEGDAWVWLDHGIVRSTMFREAKEVPVGALELILWRLERLPGRWLP
jgi:hypothetical protein